MNQKRKLNIILGLTTLLVFITVMALMYPITMRWNTFLKQISSSCSECMFSQFLTLSGFHRDNPPPYLIDSISLDLKIMLFLSIIVRFFFLLAIFQTFAFGRRCLLFCVERAANCLAAMTLMSSKYRKRRSDKSHRGYFL